MSTPEHASSYDQPRSGAPAPNPLWRRPIVLGGAAAVVAAAAVGWVLLPGSDDAGTTGDPTTVSYSIGAADIMQSCLQVADIEPMTGAAALGGVVTEVDGNEITIDIDRWYQGGDADFVDLTGSDQSVALDGVDFVVGDRYLVTAVDSTVQVCGMSGPATQELEQLYDEWYG